MQCEHFREAIAADPAAPGDEAMAHVAGCAACAAFLAEMREQDERIARALAIDVPELKLPDLPPVACEIAGPRAGAGESAGRVPRRTRRPARRRNLPLLVGAAASAALFAVLFFRGGTVGEPAALADAVIAHMDHEQASRQVTTVAVPDQALTQVFDGRVSGVDSDLGLVSYARTCVIRGKRVPHLVVQGASGPVTLILLPDEPVAEAVPLEGALVHGVILPVGEGSVAVIGEREEQLREVREMGRRLSEAVRWRT